MKPADPKADVQALMNVALKMAETLLVAQSEFLPFGDAMKSDGELVHVSGYNGQEHPPPADIIELIAGGLRQAAAAGTYRATALAYDVRTIPPGQLDKTDAVAIELEHQHGNAVTVLAPYCLEGRTVRFGELFAVEGRRRVFGAVQ